MVLTKRFRILALALAGGLATATTVAAQAPIERLYWKEIRKDARIYVFNDPIEADRFERSGEVGRAITRPGSGPDGETVVADSETALELFFFKYGISEVVQRPPAPTMRVEWRDGKTRISTDQAYIELSNRVQARFSEDVPDDSIQLPGTAEPGDARPSFRIPRAKLKLEGWIWQQRVTYESQLNWPAASGTNPGAILEDAVVDWDMTKQNLIRVRFGQFKVPFGRQQLTSSGNQGFVDRSAVSAEFARGRDTGAALWGTTPGNAFEYRLGVFNGNGMTRSTNDNANLQVNGRFMWQPNASMAMRQRAWVSGPLYSEGDFESTDRPVYAVAVNYEHNDFHGTTTANDLESHVVGLDGILKFKGLYGTGEYYWRRRQPETGDFFHSNGWFAQSSYFLTSRRQWEVGVRYGEWEQSDQALNDKRTEVRGGVSYYYRRHNLKVQADLGRLDVQNGAAKAGSVKSNDFRVQAQFVL